LEKRLRESSNSRFGVSFQGRQKLEHHRLSSNLVLSHFHLLVLLELEMDQELAQCRAHIGSSLYELVEII
jgi:hypothetical protein